MNLRVHMYVMTLYLQGIISCKFNVCFTQYVLLVNLLIRLIVFCRGRPSDQVSLLTRRLRCKCKFIAESIRKFCKSDTRRIIEGFRRLASSRGAPV